MSNSMGQPQPQLGGYRIDALVGRGATGSVYRAWQESLARWVALKLLDPSLSSDRNFRARFLQESMLAAHVDHPNILPVYDAGASGDLLYITMRYVEGTDLRRLLSSRGTLSLDQTLSVVGQTANALEAAHAGGIIHRDVKPENILIERDHVYLADFGIAKQSAAPVNLTTTSVFVGTLRYASPEQIDNKELDARTDVYSLACVAYECFAGAPAFDGESNYAVMNAHLTGTPRPLHLVRPDLPQSLDRAIQKGLARDRDDRYASAIGFATALRSEPGLMTERVSVPHRPAEPVHPTRHPRAVWIAASVSLVVLLAIVALNYLASAALRPGPAASASSPSGTTGAISTVPVSVATRPSPTVGFAPPSSCSIDLRSQASTLCDFSATMELGTAPMHVVLASAKSGNDTTQTLTIYQQTAAGAEERLWVGTAEATPTGDTFSQLFSFYPAAGQPAQLAYAVAHCGANCGAYDIVVLAVLGGRIQEALRTSVGRGGSVDWTGDHLRVRSNFYAVSEPLCCPSGSRSDLYTWNGSSYQFSHAQLLAAGGSLNTPGIAPSVIDLFYQFLQRRQFAAAWMLFSDEWKANQPYDNFASGFSQTLTTRFQPGTIQILAGGTARVNGSILATESMSDTPAGYVTQSTYAGSYDVRYNGKWEISGGDLQLTKRTFVRN